MSNKNNSKTGKTSKKGAAPPPATSATPAKAPAKKQQAGASTAATPVPSHAPTNGAGKPRRPFGSAFRWDMHNVLEMTSNDGLVTASVNRQPGGHYDLNLSIRNWQSPEDAQQVFYILAAVLLDDDAYLLRYDEFNFEILNQIGAGVLRQRRAVAQQALRRAAEMGIQPEDYADFFDNNPIDTAPSAEASDEDDDDPPLVAGDEALDTDPSI